MTTAISPFVFAVGNDIYVSPNVQRPPTPAELCNLDVQFSDPLLPSDAFHLRYATNRFPYLGFTIAHTRYNSAVLKPLDYSQLTLPIRILGGQFCLEPAVAESWRELELNLRILVSKLFERYRPLMAPDYEIFPYPEDYGYAKGRHTEDGMRRAAMRARKAFAPLMALCSFAITMTPKFTEDAPAWVAYVGENGAHPRWLQELRRTPIVNFSKQARHMGCVIRPKPNCQFLEHIPKFVMANVPVWLVWNHPSDYHGSMCAVYKPSEQAVSEAKLRAQALTDKPVMHHMPSPPHSVFNEPPSTTLEEPPEPEQFSGQRKGETVFEFMERRAQKDMLLEQKESPKERAAREQKIAAAQTYALPGKKGAKVFEWEAEGKYWIRKAMPRGYVEQRWADMAPGHLRYNSFRHEWDYCELFDPSAEPTADDDYNHDDFVQDYYQGQVSLDDASHGTPRTHRGADIDGIRDTSFGMKNLENIYVPEQNRGGFTHPEPLNVILTLCYGFCAHMETATPDASSWVFARKTLSDTESPWPWTDWKSAVCNFVGLAITNSVRADMWDLDVGSASPVLFFNDDLVVERVTNGSRVFYRIVPRCAPTGEEPHWDLLVPDAITAVECLRRSHGSLDKAGLVHFFLQTGRPFTTREPIHPPPPPPRAAWVGRYSIGGLGERHVNYKPDVLDYKGYERDRAAFLKSDRARAALQAGGIVWRLAIEHMHFDDVLGGPSDLAAALYKRFEGESVGGWDDQLTDDELDLICGVYKIFTSPGVYQQADASWWPKSSTWKLSCMDVGYWTPTCEEWYQRRLRGIRNGTEKVKIASRWKESLKLHKPSKAFVQNVRSKCDKVLNPSLK